MTERKIIRFSSRDADILEWIARERRLDFSSLVRSTLFEALAHDVALAEVALQEKEASDE